MKVEYINPFLTATLVVFETMLGYTLTRKEPFIKNGTKSEHEISGMIGLSGKAKGTVVLSLEKSAALKIAECMLEEKFEDLNADVTDAVGELTNMIAGHAKAQLEELQMGMSLPSVIKGKGHTVEFPRNVTPICIPFGCDWGTVVLEVGLTEVV